VKGQELWVAATRRDWSTLVVIPAQADGSALMIANILVEAGGALSGHPVELFFAEGADLRLSGTSLVDSAHGEIEARPLPHSGLPAPRGRFERIIALEPLSLNPKGIVVAQGAEAVLMVAQRNLTQIKDARRIVDLVGRDRFVGCVMVDGTRKP
jgi:hypothetical protein